MATYRYKIIYKLGKNIGHADAQSWMPLSYESIGVEVTCHGIYDQLEEKLLSYNDIAVQTSADPV